MYLDGHTFRLSGGGDRHGKFAKRLGHRRIQGHCQSDVLARVSQGNVYPLMYRELASRQIKQSSDHPAMNDVLDGIQRKARDHGRSPMQWDSSENGGFSRVPPWMRVNDDYPQWNVSKQTCDKDSILRFWQAMLKFRKQYLACVSVPNQPRLTKDIRPIRSHRP